MPYDGGDAFPWMFPIVFPIIFPVLFPIGFMMIMMPMMRSSGRGPFGMMSSDSESAGGSASKPGSRPQSSRRGGPMQMMGGMAHGSERDAGGMAHGDGGASEGGGTRAEGPLEIAQRRYASGEITREEFQQLREDLGE